MHRTLWAIAILLCLHVNYLYAQPACTVKVSGTVQEKHNNAPLFPAVIHIDELGADYETDEKGRFFISGLCSNTYTIHVHSSSYEHYEQKIVLTADTVLRIRLSHKTHELTEVHVSALKEHALIQSNQQMDKNEIAANNGNTLTQMLQSINGVTMLSNGGNISKPVIHGLHSNRIVMLNNGVRQEDQQWGAEHAPNIDPFLANSITVLKGAASVRYGTDAIAGVIIVDPAPLPVTPGWKGEINLAGFSNNRMGVSSAMIEHNFKKAPSVSFRMQGTLKKGGTYRIPQYWVANAGTEENNFSAALGLKKLHYGGEIFYSRFNTTLGIYRGAHTGNEKDLLAAINSDTPLVPADFTYDIQRPMQHVVHNMLKTKLYADTRAGLLNLIYAYQHNYRQEYDVMRKEDGKAQLNLTLNTHTLNLNLDHKPIGEVKGQIGIDGIVQENSFLDGDRLFIPAYNSVGGAVYAIERYKLHAWNLEGGLRYDYRWYQVFNPEGKNQQIVSYRYNYNSLSATLGASHAINNHWDVSFTMANAWRAPQANELFSAGLHHGAARIELGNKNLQPERSYNLNIESKYASNKLSADISVYAQYINNYIYLEPGTDLLTIRGYFKTFNYRQTTAFIPGADVSLKYQWNDHFSTNIRASIVRGRDADRNDWLILMPSDRLSMQLKYTQDISNTLQDCFIGLNGSYVFKQERIPSNFDSIDYPRPPAAYFLLGAETGTKLQFSTQPVFISLAATNILNTAYRDYLDAFRYFINQPGLNIVLRIRVPFNF